MSGQPSQEPNDETIGASTPGHPEGLERNPDDWTTSDEPMTDAQRSYLDTLAKDAGEQLPSNLSKADASKHIDRLQNRSNRI